MMRIKHNSKIETYRRNRTEGLTLVELLISMLLVLIVTGAVGTLLFIYIAHFEQTGEITAARQRGEMVLAILEEPILHAGMGMPNSGDFSGSPFGWGGPLTVGSNDPYGDELKLVYAVPVDAVIESVDVTNHRVTFNGDADLGSFQQGTGSDLKEWALFPSVEEPFLIETKGLLSLTVPSDSDVDKIAIYDNLCSLRSMRALVQDSGGGFPAFYTDDDKAGVQPRVQGIGALHFKWDPDMSNLTASILALGSTRHDEVMTAGDVPLWDEDNWGWDEDYRHYRLVVINGRWRVRN